MNCFLFYKTKMRFMWDVTNHWDLFPIGYALDMLLPIWDVLTIIWWENGLMDTVTSLITEAFVRLSGFFPCFIWRKYMLFMVCLLIILKIQWNLFICRDYRGNKVALFDGIEEGGIRASASYSHEIDEHDNERAVDGLQDRVNLLKRVSPLVL